MKLSPLHRAAAALAVIAAATASWAQEALPQASAQNVPETFFGTTVDDPYRHFEDPKAPEVAAWMKAHSDHAQATLRRINGRDALRAKIERLDSSAPARVTGVERRRGELYFYERRGAKDDQFKLYMRQGLGGKEKLLFDPETLKRSTGKPHAINYFAPSPDGKLVAVGVSAAGSEDASLRILDTRSGRQIGGEITRAQFGGPSWAPDGSELFFNRLQEFKPGMPSTDKYQRSTVVALRPGEAEKDLRTLMRAGDDLDIPATEFPAFDVQPDGRVLAYVIDGVSPDFRALHTTLTELRGGKAEWKPLVEREDRVTALAVKGDRVYALSFRDAPRYKLIGGKLDGFSAAKAQVLLPESQKVLTNVAAAADGLYIELRDGNVKRLLKAAYADAESAQEVALPVSGNFKFVGVRSDLPGVMLDLQGWNRARQIYAVSPKGKVQNTGLQPSGPFDAPSGIVATEVMVKSHDGTMVPMSIIHKEGVKLDGTNPTLLYGYGSYGITEEPWFSYSRLAWMDAGGVFAVANPRGSGVFGRKWHEAGRQATKPNTWKDFIACAEYLIAQKWTQPSRLSIWGGSAGGILVGRAMTERPDLFAAVVPSVGALDMIRMETTPNGVPNIPEFGTRTTEEGFRSLLAMSTYHHIKDGTKYPAVLLPHGVNDPRVEVWHTTKAGARLLAASTSGKPVLLRLNYDAGHGVGNTKSQIFDEVADVFAFALWQMGVPGYELKQP
ncbi:MAG TPA: prolyl oligopeptidase family serine peptidase [Albitalea sp.]